MFSSGEASTLGSALTSVRRRVLIRRAATGALAGAALAVAPAYLLSTAWLAPLVAAAGAWLATRRRAAPPSAWIDAADRDDLVLTATAVIDHRARATDLASIVVTSAADRAGRVRPPALLPAALALAATVALIIMIPIAGPEPAHGTRSAARPTGTSVRLPDTAEQVPRTRPPEQVPRTRSGEPADVSAPPAEVLRTFLSEVEGKGGHGEGEGRGAALRGPVEGVATTAVATSEVETAAPVAGAAADVVAVPARYRQIVAAYLEAR